MKPSRTIPFAGILCLGLTLAACSLDVPGPDRAPVAVVEAPSRCAPDETQTLLGNRSFDPEGEDLQYTWSLRRGEGTLESADEAVARYTPATTGRHLLALVVSAGGKDSEPALVALAVLGSDCSADDDCDDGNACTDDACGSDGRCAYQELNDGDCDDGLFCTEGDRCQAGQCAGDPVDCDDADPCSDDTCDEELDRCVHSPVSEPPGLEEWAEVGTCDDGLDNDCDGQTDGADPGCASDCEDLWDCDDNSACTDDDCVDHLCEHTVVPGRACDDGDRCTENDLCQADGACLGQAKDCDDGDPCTEDSCNPETGGCLHPTIADPPPEDLDTAGSCADGRDNDCDGFTDRDDEGCWECEFPADCGTGNSCVTWDCTEHLCGVTVAEDGTPCNAITAQVDCPHECLAGTCQPPAWLPAAFCPATDEDLRLCLTFDSDLAINTAEGVRDDSGNNNHGRVATGAYVAGREALALQLDGDSGIFINSSASLEHADGLSLEAWIHPASLPGSGRVGIMDKNNQYGLFINHDLGLRCTGGGATLIGGLPEVGRWTHVVCTVDPLADEAYLYVNGVQVDSEESLDLYLGTSTAVLAVGANSPSGDPFHGLIDGVRIWNRALDPTLICWEAKD